MRKFAFILCLLLLIPIAAAVALPFLVPVGAIVAEVERQIEATTGRALTIKGRVDLSYFPSIAVTADQVHFAGVRQGEDLLSVKRLAVRLRLMPLLRGKAEVEKFVLTEPLIDLTVDKQGKPNWDVSLTGTPSPADHASPGFIGDLSLAEVEVTGGRLRYNDVRTGMVREATDVNITLSLPDLDGAMIMEASALLNGTPLSLDLGIDPVRPLLSGGAAGMALRLAGAGAGLDVKGQVQRQGDAPLSLSGDLALTVTSMADLIKAATGVEPSDLPVNDLNLTGKLSGTPARLALAGLSAKAGDLTANGNLSVKLDGARPALGGSLSLPRLELDRYLPAPAAPDPAAPAPEVGPAGWSKERIDLSALKTADLDLTLQLAGLVLKGVEAGATTLTLKLTDGRLTAGLADTALFGGTLGGKLTLDAARPSLSLAVVATARGVQAEPLLTRFAGFDRLSGATDGSIDIRTSGSNQQELVGGLNGTGSVMFRNGAVKGVNLAQIVRTAIGHGSAEPPQTDFAEMSGAFTLTDGIAATEDFHLLAPLLRVTGKGNVNLPSKRVDMRLTPKLVGSLEGQGTTRIDVDGITVPVRVRGTFDNLSWTPDLSSSVKAALKDPKKAQEQLEKLKTKEGAKGVLKGLLGKKP
ncbi:AsmA family protein [Niveispirillum sp.]|uniref:AsmA family protein n=1 Tax=Niveispirillum sp. TaxID=1917217 RepID=UPI001B4AAECE|nr:AsmA family protein [Niveispirillum sp.]MBP7337596.1 AsmA family protein [Niveispirillum sp.]